MLNVLRVFPVAALFILGAPLLPITSFLYGWVHA